VCHIACRGEIRNVYVIFREIFRKKKPFVRNLIRWIYHIKIDLLEIMLETGTSVVDLREKLRYWQRLYMNKAGRVN
jgi:hypothetical protein